MQAKYTILFFEVQKTQTKQLVRLLSDCFAETCSRVQEKQTGDKKYAS